MEERVLGNDFGMFIRDAAHGKVQKNKTFWNCLGIVFLNTDEAEVPPEFQSPLDRREGLAREAEQRDRQQPGVPGWR